MYVNDITIKHTCSSVIYRGDQRLSYHVFETRSSGNATLKKIINPQNKNNPSSAKTKTKKKFKGCLVI